MYCIGSMACNTMDRFQPFQKLRVQPGTIRIQARQSAAEKIIKDDSV